MNKQPNAVIASGTADDIYEAGAAAVQAVRDYVEAS